MTTNEMFEELIELLEGNPELKAARIMCDCDKGSEHAISGVNAWTDGGGSSYVSFEIIED